MRAHGQGGGGALLRADNAAWTHFISVVLLPPLQEPDPQSSTCWGLRTLLWWPARM